LPLYLAFLLAEQPLLADVTGARMSNVKDASEKISPFAGKPATLEMLVDVPSLVTAY
jgi:hypothetical protein